MRKLIVATMALGFVIGSTAFASKNPNADCPARTQQGVSSMSPQQTMNLVASFDRKAPVGQKQESESGTRVTR